MNIKTIPDQIVLNSLKNISYGKIQFINYDGKVTLLGADSKGKTVTLRLKKPGLTFELINKGSIGLAESYMRGDFDTDNLTDLIEIAAKNISKIHKFSGILDFPLVNFFKKFIIKNTKKKSKENISKHYDLGNEFFSLWLDRTLTYSSAIFEDEKQTLSDAQKNKYQKLINLLKPKDNSNVLEIGCGWGGFSTYAAKNFKSKIDAITISKAQFEYASKKVQKEGLGEKVSIKFKDYREIDSQYSNIASIEMFEAVGKKYWEKYFDVIKNSLVNSGKAALQIITIDEKRSLNYQNQPDFIQQYIFPGGMLPTKKELLEINQKVGLDFSEIKSFGQSYAKTLNMWNNQFQNSWQDLLLLGFNKRFKRMWEFYLAYCETGFISKSTDVSHFLINK